jgi:hypothetical protein
MFFYRLLLRNLLVSTTTNSLQGALCFIAGVCFGLQLVAS